MFLKQLYQSPFPVYGSVERMMSLHMSDEWRVHFPAEAIAKRLGASAYLGEMWRLAQSNSGLADAYSDALVDATDEAITDHSRALRVWGQPVNSSHPLSGALCNRFGRGYGFAAYELVAHALARQDMPALGVLRQIIFSTLMDRYDHRKLMKDPHYRNDQYALIELPSQKGLRAVQGSAQFLREVESAALLALDAPLSVHRSYEWFSLLLTASRTAVAPQMWTGSVLDFWRSKEVSVALLAALAARLPLYAEGEAAERVLARIAGGFDYQPLVAPDGMSWAFGTASHEHGAFGVNISLVSCS